MTSLDIAFVGPADPSLFEAAAGDSTLRPLRLQPTPPNASDMPAGDVRPYAPFRQEDAERALTGASALVLGLPVPVPRALVANGRPRDTQAFVVDGLMTAAHSLGIRHIAVVKTEQTPPRAGRKKNDDELDRIVRSYGMDVLEFTAAETPNVHDAVVRWLQRCARVAHMPSPAPPLATRDPRIRRTPTGRSMRSLQRLPLPRGWDAGRLARAYATWIGTSFALLRTNVESDGSFSILSKLSRKPLLELAAEGRVDQPRRRVFLVQGGTLAADPAARDGWLEFRLLPGGKEAIVAVGDFVPRLPWPVYRMTQAPAHRFIMVSFAKHLKQELRSGPQRRSK